MKLGKIVRMVFLYLCLLILISFTSYSQLSVGIHAGVTFGKGTYKTIETKNNPDNYSITNDYLYDIDGTIEKSFAFGGLLETKLYGVIYFQTEINCIDHRISIEKTGRYFNGDIADLYFSGLKLSIKYIEIPFLLKIKKEYNNFVPFAFAGVGFGFLYKSKDINNLSYSSSTSDYTKENQSFALFGFGSEYKLNTFCDLFLTFRYSNSLVDVANSNKIYFKPNNYDILLGVKLNIIDY